MLRILLLPAVVALTVTGSALAQVSQASDGAPITRQEAVQRADGLFDALDVNHDGVLTRFEAKTAGSELKAERSETGVDVAPGVGGHTGRYMKRHFALEKSITREQFDRAFMAHFDKMDRNHDGILTAEERALAQ